MKRFISVLLTVLMLFGFAVSAGAQVYTLSEVNDMVSRIDGMNRFIENQSHVYRISTITETIAKMNGMLNNLKLTHPEIPVYVYFVESSTTLPLQDVIDPESEFYKNLKQQLHADRFSHLEITSSEQLFSYFYSTDKHWNYKGSYQGYLDVCDLLSVEGERMIPVETVTFPVFFNGTLAKSAKDPMSDEQFTVYRFEGLPAFETSVNGKKKQYEGSQDYFSGKYGTDTYRDHYSSFYGGNPGVVIYETNQTDKKDLLILCNSFSNPVGTLLTKHYNTIHSVDLRHFNEETNVDFSLQQYVEYFGIDEVLILSDVWLYSCGTLHFSN